jgi:integrase
VMLLSTNDLRNWRDNLVDKGVPAATINRTRAGLRAALELAATLDHRIGNRSVFKDGLKGLRGGNNARRVVLPDADVLRIVAAAYQEDYTFGVLVEVLAESGARVSQAARLRCIDLQADGPEPRLLMPASHKGGGREKKLHQTPVPISTGLAVKLKAMRGDRGADARLLIKGDGTYWQEVNRCDHSELFRAVVTQAGFDPDVVTAYALRHSAICRELLHGVPVIVVARTHDTSPDEIQRHYARYILDVAGDISRRALLRPEAPTVENVVPLSGRLP